MNRTTRRELVGAATVAGAMAAVPPAWAARLLSTRPGIGPGSFDDGVASGEPSSTAVTFWSRLNSTRPRSGARLIVAKDAGMRHTVATAVIPTGASINGTLKTRIGGLKPSTEYFYAWESGNHHSPIGRTRTFPSPNSRQPLRIGFSSCQHYTYGYFSPHRAAAADDLDIYAFLGDYIYDRGRAPHPEEPRQDTLSGNDLRSYRRKYALYRTDSGLRELHRLQPIVHVWDDHELSNNYSDGHTVVAPLQRAAAYRASFEWMPRMAVQSDRFKIYKRISMGLMADLFLLDERQYRTVETGGNPGSILGEPQMKWLIAALKASKARWKVIANQVTIAPMDFGNGPSADSWGGYPDDRNRLLAEIEGAGVQNVVFLTGDAHVFMVNLLASDEDAFRSDPQHHPAAVEYVGGSVTSPGGQRSEADVQSMNPWNREFNSEQHGYAYMAADETQLVTEYRRSNIESPRGATSPFERFTQPSGVNNVTRESIPAPIPPPPPPGPEPSTARQV